MTKFNTGKGLKIGSNVQKNVFYLAACEGMTTIKDTTNKKQNFSIFILVAFRAKAG